MKASNLILMTFAALTTSLAAQSASAHAELTETIPADRAMVAAAPEEVKLRFSEPVRLTALSVQKDGAPKRSLGPLPSDTVESFDVALPVLDDGHYVVTWRALSEDTHVMSGEFMFAVGAPGSHAEHMNHAAEHGAEGSDSARQEHHDEHAAAH